MSRPQPAPETADDDRGQQGGARTSRRAIQLRRVHRCLDHGRLLASARPRLHLPAVLVFLVCASAAVSGCFGGEEDTPDVAPGLQPEVRSVYMDQVVSRYNILHDAGEVPWRPVVVNRRRWNGDPATYEEVCGARFLDEDGTVPEFSSEVSGGGTYYDALRADRARWAAFNAWIADPAVRRAVSDTAANVEAGGGPGGKPDIGDYSACTDRRSAGVPAG